MYQPLNQHGLLKGILFMVGLCVHVCHIAESHGGARSCLYLTCKALAITPAALADAASVCCIACSWLQVMSATMQFFLLRKLLCITGMIEARYMSTDGLIHTGGSKAYACLLL